MSQWRDLMSGCGDKELSEALVASIETLFERNIHALKVDASERHIVAELARHIRAQGLVAPDGGPWDVDVEYNRKGALIKTVNGGQQLVVPDVIIHRVGTDQNFLVVEVKKGTSSQPDVDDMHKLFAYKQAHELNYRHALFLRLGVRDRAGAVTCLAWA